MSKIAIALNVVLLVTTAHSEWDATPAEEFRRTVFFNDNSMVREDIEQVHRTAKKEFEKLLPEVFSIAKDFSTEVMNITMQVPDEIVKFQLLYDAGNTTECVRNSTLSMVTVVSRVMSQANECIIKQLEEGYTYMKKVEDIYVTVAANIKDITMGMWKCIEAKDTCSPEMLGAKTFVDTAIAIPAMETQTHQYLEWWETAKLKVANCTDDALRLLVDANMDRVSEAKDCFILKRLENIK